MRNLQTDDLVTLGHQVAGSFLALPDLTRTRVLREMTVSQRRDLLVGLALAVRDHDAGRVTRVAYEPDSTNDADPTAVPPLLKRFRPEGARPLSPYEHLTGERFSDHVTAADRALDSFLS